jgi:putative pyruvate formate lyase activating enzyme
MAELNLLSHCCLCPRSCDADRLSGGKGYCKTDSGFAISSICKHQGEEPVISGENGICNIFFSHCNLQCIYCQNHLISNIKAAITKNYTLKEVVHFICEMLEQTENIVGFVSPSHNIPQVMAIIRRLRQLGKHPVFVYNTNGYDKVSSLRMLEDYIDVYLPDFKYMDAGLSFRYSGIKDYPAIATAAIKEMYRQKGATLLLSERGIAESGMIVRHLVIPGASDQSIQVLKYISEEISCNLHISLMSQYYPSPRVLEHPFLKRTLTLSEYEKVVAAFHEFGFYRGWTQEMDSNSIFRPDFSQSEPFYS